MGCGWFLLGLFCSILMLGGFHLNNVRTEYHKQNTIEQVISWLSITNISGLYGDDKDTREATLMYVYLNINNIKQFLNGYHYVCDIYDDFFVYTLHREGFPYNKIQIYCDTNKCHEIHSLQVNSKCLYKFSEFSKGISAEYDDPYICFIGEEFTDNISSEDLSKNNYIHISANGKLTYSTPENIHKLSDKTLLNNCRHRKVTYSVYPRKQHCNNIVIHSEITHDLMGIDCGGGVCDEATKKKLREMEIRDKNSEKKQKEERMSF